MCREMPFAAVARRAETSWHRVRAICARYVELALDLDDLSGLPHVGIDETSRAKGHNYVTAVADTEGRRLVLLAEGRKSGAVSRSPLVGLTTPAHDHFSLASGSGANSQQATSRTSRRSANSRRWLKGALRRFSSFPNSAKNSCRQRSSKSMKIGRASSGTDVL